MINVAMPEYPTNYAVPFPVPDLTAPSPAVDGIDVSTYQGNIDYIQVEKDGIKFVAIRCTVGDYYTDPRFASNWAGFGATSILRTPYLVVAPAPYTGGPPISAQAHWNRFIAMMGDKQPELPIVLDCELSRGQGYNYISDLIAELAGMVLSEYGRHPLIYTRGAWWNANTRTRQIFPLCDLWITRYNSVIDHPWEDNVKYKPRDWDYWHFWQYSDEGILPGIPDYKVDLDWWNGTLEELLVYAEQSPPVPPGLDEVWDAIYELRDVAANHESRIKALEEEPPADPPPSGDYLNVVINNEDPDGHNPQYFKTWDESCGDDKNGKPLFEPDNNLPKMMPGDTFTIYAARAWSCHDNPNDPVIFGDGMNPHYQIYQPDTPYHHRFIRAWLADIV